LTALHTKSPGNRRPTALTEIRQKNLLAQRLQSV
jgi:hypothetical protein